MNKKKLVSLMLVGIMSTGVILSGCGNDNEAKKKDEQVLNILGFDYKTLDPSLVSDGDSFFTLNNVYEGLMKERSKGGKTEIVPAGCEKYDVSPDKLTYTFHLRKNAKWSDGKPVTAQQYVYSWKRLVNPKTGSDYMGILDELNVKGAEEIMKAAEAKQDTSALIDKLGVEAKDDYTFVVTLSKETPFFVNALTFKDLVPVREDKVKEQGDKFGSDYKNTVYNGPFVVASYQKGSKIVYNKNDKYWNSKIVKLKQCNGTMVNEASTVVKMFESGELDTCGASKSNLLKLKKKAESGEIDYVRGLGSSSSFLYYNLNKKEFKNIKVRQALSLCLDRKEYLDVLSGRFVPSYGLVPSEIACGSKEYRKEVKEPISRNKEKAKKLMTEGLQELGEKPSDFTISILEGPKTSATSDDVDYFGKLYKETFGINVKADFAPDNQSYFKQRVEGKFDLASGSWSADYDDVSSYFGCFVTGNGNNNGKYSNKEFDKLVKEAATEGNEAKRLDLYKQAEQIVIEKDPAVIPLLYQDINSFRKKYLKNFRLNKFGGDYDFTEAYIEGKNN